MARTDIIESIEKKVSRLIADNQKLREEKSRLANSKETIREENRGLTAKIAELERKVTVLELREGFSGETVDKTSTKAAKARVNRLMREVDSCIALLNRD